MTGEQTPVGWKKKNKYSSLKCFYISLTELMSGSESPVKNISNMDIAYTMVTLLDGQYLGVGILEQTYFQTNQKDFNTDRKEWCSGERIVSPSSTVPLHLPEVAPETPLLQASHKTL